MHTPCYTKKMKWKMYDRSLSVEDRFWEKVSKQDGDKCWEWLGSLNKPKNGYGCFNVKRKPVYAHRYSYTLHYGPIPDGLLVLHRCDNPKCVRPDHLFLGTHQANLDDAKAKQRMPHSHKHWNTKLTVDQVRSIRAEYDSGNRAAHAIAAKFGISPTQAFNIGTRRRWTYLD